MEKAYRSQRAAERGDHKQSGGGGVHKMMKQALAQKSKFVAGSRGENDVNLSDTDHQVAPNQTPGET